MRSSTVMLRGFLAARKLETSIIVLSAGCCAAACNLSINVWCAQQALYLSAHKPVCLITNPAVNVPPHYLCPFAAYSAEKNISFTRPTFDTDEKHDGLVCKASTAVETFLSFLFGMRYCPQRRLNALCSASLVWLYTTKDDDPLTSKAVQRFN